MLGFWFIHVLCFATTDNIYNLTCIVVVYLQLYWVHRFMYVIRLFVTISFPLISLPHPVYPEPPQPFRIDVCSIKRIYQLWTVNACVDDDDGFPYSKLSALLKGVKRRHSEYNEGEHGLELGKLKMDRPTKAFEYICTCNMGSSERLITNHNN